ncbi:hypothetical protein V2J94_20920 [Streptomyces sp. DSM 41524]|uniref:TPM domain-containing protein n=1 Tax=Streptomyces asiaticus subsp. ignotus TaxID=3098222 RepID=A0ABU7Q1M9_9ACTN|nr:hypothetical protein [Streptomyces sp. DASNCL29]MEE4594319.1 hypothetical protein [Streptomyces sp. DSM 41524]TMU97502.1 hypothetical protein FGK60_06230 [Streptomyces sp. DASNCL29]
MRSVSGKMPRWGTLLLAVLVALTAVLLTAGGAHAETDVNKIGKALRSSPVYVDPGASDALSAGQARALVAHIRTADVPVYVAVLPDNPAYGGERVFGRLRAAVDRPGVYAVALGSSFGAASDTSVLPGGTSRALAERNLRQHPHDLAAVLNGFVTDTATAIHDRTGQGSGGDQGARGSTLSTGDVVAVLIVLAAVGASGLYLVRRTRKQRRERERAALDQVRGAVEEDITAYGEKLGGTRFDPADPASTPEMADDYGRALDAYEEAKARSAAARRPEDVRPVTEALEEGRFALAVLEARREGGPLPQRRPPCFFDPRHGPSVRDVPWAPPGGTQRSVPACAADATRVDDGRYPDARTVPVGGDRRRPYWDAGPAYGPWASGYFGGYGSMLLPGLLVGTLLGGSLGPDYGNGGFDGGFGDGGNGGDSGGGFDDGGFGGGFGDGGGFDGGFGGGFGDG